MQSVNLIQRCLIHGPQLQRGPLRSSPMPFQALRVLLGHLRVDVRQ